MDRSIVTLPSLFLRSHLALQHGNLTLQIVHLFLCGGIVRKQRAVTSVIIFQIRQLVFLRSLLTSDIHQPRPGSFLALLQLLDLQRGLHRIHSPQQLPGHQHVTLLHIQREYSPASLSRDRNLFSINLSASVEINVIPTSRKYHRRSGKCQYLISFHDPNV